MVVNFIIERSEVEVRMTCYRDKEEDMGKEKDCNNAPRMEFLGMMIGQGEIKMDKKKLEAIKEWKPPTSVKGIRSFIGFANFYRKFIPDFSNIITPLNLLTHKGEPWAWT